MSGKRISELANKRISEWTKAGAFAYSLITVIALILFGLTAFAQKGNDLITEGNKLYEKGEFSEAEVRYRKAETEKGNAFISKFNLGDAMFKQQRYEEAAAAFGQLPALTEDKKQKAAAYHNLGNSLLKTKKYQESVDAYKQALRNDPKDEDTKYNLSYARRMLQQQQEQQKQDQDKKDDKKEDNKDDQQQQNKDDQKKDDKNKDQQQQQQQDQDKEGEKDEQKQQKPNEISREDAERMLESINQDEKDVRDRMEQQKVKVQKGKVEKDW